MYWQNSESSSIKHLLKLKKQVIMIAMQLDLVIDIRMYMVEELISLSI